MTAHHRRSFGCHAARDVRRVDMDRHGCGLRGDVWQWSAEDTSGARSLSRIALLPGCPEMARWPAEGEDVAAGEIRAEGTAGGNVRDILDDTAFAGPTGKVRTRHFIPCAKACRHCVFSRTGPGGRGGSGGRGGEQQQEEEVLAAHY